MHHLTYRPHLTYAPLTGGSPKAWIASHTAQASALAAPLPPNVQLTTIQSLATGTALLRLAHLYAVGEDAVQSQNVTVALATLFAGARVTSATEYTLAGGQPLANVEPMVYQLPGGRNLTVPIVPPAPAGASLAITLTPMQIRTFLITTA